MVTKVTFTNSQIQFIITNEAELHQFSISINSFYDDILNLKLKVNVKTTEELMPLIKSLKMLDGIELNISTSTSTGIIIPTNCIVFPNTLSELKDDDLINEEHALVQVLTPNNLKELIESISTTCVIPKKILLFKESDILPRDFIPILMKNTYGLLLQVINKAETILKDIENRMNTKVEQEYDQHFNSQQ
jgi:hypothetical protein